MSIDRQASQKPCTVAVNTLLCRLSLQLLRSDKNLARWTVEFCPHPLVRNYIQKSEHPWWHPALEMYICAWWARRCWVGAIYPDVKPKPISDSSLLRTYWFHLFSCLISNASTIEPSRWVYLGPEHTVPLPPPVVCGCLEVPDAGHLIAHYPH